MPSKENYCQGLKTNYSFICYKQNLLTSESFNGVKTDPVPKAYRPYLREEKAYILIKI